jgi:transcription elongation factor Elf1
MLIEIQQTQQEYQRLSKRGTVHTYVRTHKVAILQCDSCGLRFTRRTRNMDPRRLTVEHSHVCAECNQKQYAQSKGVENKRFWNTTVDLDRDIDSI